LLKSGSLTLTVLIVINCRNANNFAYIAADYNKLHGVLILVTNLKKFPNKLICFLLSVNLKFQVHNNIFDTSPIFL